MVVNIKTYKEKDFVFCGRPSKWGNPFVIGKDGSREDVILKYRLWINSQPDLLVDLKELKNKKLGCFCSPARCHCEILKELSDSKYIKNWFSNMLSFDEALVYQETKYLTVENFYQAMKLSKNRLDLRKEISEMPPHKAKVKIRNKERYLWDESWTKEKSLQVMEYALKWKFKKGTEWFKKLKLTKDLNLEIIEWNNWGDIFWGKDIRTRAGENHLGKILMKIRDI